MNSEENPWRWGKTERGKETKLVLGAERRGSTTMCPNFSSLLFLSLSPLCSFVHGQKVGGAGRGEGFRVWEKERGYVL
jgi:hypothetical protein